MSPDPTPDDRATDPTDPNSRRLPLAGVRVLDVGTRLSAPFCAALLGEQGADVIKVEQPGTGDFDCDRVSLAIQRE